MSNELAIPRGGEIESNHANRLGEIERRVLVMGDEPDDEGGCCTVLCCNDDPFTTQNVGVSTAYCTVPLEETPGDAVRLAFNAMIVVEAMAAGLVILDIAAAVNGTAYLERAEHTATMGANDKVTLHVTNTIDTADASPSCSIIVRNLNTTQIRVRRVNLQVLVYGVREGSTACGEVAGTG